MRVGLDRIGYSSPLFSCDLRKLARDVLESLEVEKEASDEAE